MNRFRPARGLLAALGGLLWSTAPASAQFSWSVFDETNISPIASTAADRVSVTVPAGQRVTLITTNIVPADLSPTASAPYVVSFNFTVSGGLTNLAAGTRAIGAGLFNHNSTPANFADDNGYFVWLNGRSTGSLIETRRRNSGGPSASLLNPTGASFGNLGSGGATQTAGSLTDGVPYTLTLRFNRSTSGIALGSGAGTDVAGVWIRGDGLSQTAFTNADSPAATTLFNEFAFMFFNTSGAPVTLTLDSFSGLTAAVAPVIVAQPQQLIVNPTQGGTLTVAATGTLPLTYQWRKEGVPIGGASGQSYAVPAGETGTFSVAVTNAYGTTFSSGVQVIVSNEPVAATIVSHPISQTANLGQTVTFTVNAFGSAPLTYEWQKNSVAIAGTNSPIYTIAGAAAADAGVYSVVVRNAVTAAVSNPATLTVNSPPAITLQPASASVALGQPAQLSVGAAGSGPLTYQWSKDGAPLSGATNAVLAFAQVAAASLGTYTVRVTGASGSITSNAAVLTTPSTMTVTARLPANGAEAVNADTPLRLTFDRAVRAGVSGRIRILRAADNTVVDTLDLGATPTRLVGTNPTPYNFLPVMAAGSTLTIYPRAGALAYNQTYYVTLESGVVLDASGATFPGSSDPAAWRFTTKNAGPLPGTAAVSVATDGTGDFSTVQGAIDFVPAGNTARVVITVRRGTYNELLYIGSTKPLISVRGEDRAGTVIAYPNNNNFNSGNNRAMVSVDANDFTLESITLRNTTPRGGSQAEALRGNGQRGVLNRVNLSSYQDTLLWNGTLFVADSLIEGDVDFMWGSGACYFQRCELKALTSGAFYAQVRNSEAGKGNVYVDCRLTAADGVTGAYLARIDPRANVANTWPFSQVVYVNCAMGAHIARDGWRLDNATSAPNVRFWEFKSTDLDGATLDVSGRLRDSRQIDDSTAAQYRDPQFVVGFAPSILPTIETAPAAQSVVAGTHVRFSVGATGVPAPVYEWRKNGVPIFAANGATLLLPNVQPTDAGDYSVRVTNAGGVLTSAPAALTITRGPFAGTYFGSFGAGGTFAFYVRDNNSGVFLARGPGIAGAISAHGLAVDDGGRFRFTSGTSVVDATINAAGNVSGTLGGSVAAGARSAGNGNTQNVSGYYALRANGSVIAVDAIVGTAGQAYVVVLEGPNDGGLGTVDAQGQISVNTAGGSVLSASLGSASATLRTPQGTTTRVTALSSASDASAPAQRLTGLATRARASAGEGAAIVGFVISGDAPRPVLVRGVGPTLATLGLTTALAAPKLDLFQGSALLATNSGWSTGGNASSLAAAFASVGLFSLAPGSADAALALTLAPGAYTAQISGVGGSSGNALVEIYDLAATNFAQRLSNLSTRAFAGRGEDTLIGGMIVAGTAPKRMLVRAVGPGLAQFGLSGALVRPSLTIIAQADGRSIAQNTNWSTGADAAAIAAASLESGAFPLVAAPASGNADAALLINLSPGNYTAQVTGADGGTGIALLEIYEVL